MCDPFAQYGYDDYPTRVYLSPVTPVAYYNLAKRFLPISTYYKTRTVYDKAGNWIHYFIKDIVPLVVQPNHALCKPVLRFVRNPFHSKNKRSYFKHHIL